jgi:hypothetical protein
MPMNTKLAQLACFINKIDRRYFQFAYFVVMLAGYVMLRVPSDGGGGPI